ncbi:hypothetical protein MRX96_046858 [Rhipicephalus microplus]
MAFQDELDDSMRRGVALLGWGLSKYAFTSYLSARQPSLAVRHTYQRFSSSGVEEPPALFSVAGAVKQDVLGGLLCRAFGTRRAPAVGEAKPPCSGAGTVGAKPKQEGPGTPADAGPRQLSWGGFR